MTDTNTLRKKLERLDRLALNYGGLSKSPSGKYVRLSEVLAILDTQAAALAHPGKEPKA